MADAGGPAEMDVRAPRGANGRLSLVWLVPVAALAISLLIAWQTYSQRGPLVTIDFENAAGIKPGETELRYREVPVGVVEDVTFAADLSSVRVAVRIDKEIAPYLDSGARFWVVRPEVSTRGISGLETVLSGAYIEGTWDAQIEGTQVAFRGLDRTPFVRPDRDGTRVILRSADGGQVAAGAPVLYRGIEVGQIESPMLNDDGSAIIMNAFIEAPHDRWLTTATRFWDTSGFSVSLDSAGVSLNIESLAALVQGGVSFDTVIEGGEPVAPGHLFDIFTTEAAARESLFTTDIASEVLVTAVFEGSASGLSQGARVIYKGLRVGKVQTVTASLQQVGQDRELRLLAVLALQPARLGVSADAPPEETMFLLQDAVRDGLRARLTTDNILTGSLMVEFVETDEWPPRDIDMLAEPYPRLPATVSDVSDFQATAAGVFERINALPVEEFMTNAISLLANMDRLIADEATQEVPSRIVALLDSTTNLVGSDELTAVPVELDGLLRDLRGVVADVRDGGPLEDLTASLATIDRITRNVEQASVALPETVTRVNALAGTINDLPLQDFLTAATDLVTGLDELVATEGVQQLPASVTATVDDLRGLIGQASGFVGSDALQAVPAEVQGLLGDLRGVVAELREAGAVGDVASALDRIDRITANIELASADLPQTVARINALAATANDLPLEDLITTATELVAGVQTLVASDQVQALPPAVNAALTDLQALLQGARGFLNSDAVQAVPAELQALLGDLRGTLAEIRDGGAVVNLVSAIERADLIAADLQRASADVPGIVSEVESLAQMANDLPIEDLVRAATSLVTTAEGLVGSEEVRQIPPALAAALDEIRVVLAELRTGGAVENVNGALQSARSAADAVAQATNRLPQLSERLNALVGTIETVVVAYGARSDFNSQAVSALREIRQAADAVESLSRAIERNPNSLLFGR
ncbi:MAG: MlaD family protein [Pseudomonadota bacterium]